MGITTVPGRWKTVLLNDGFRMPFRAHLKTIELDPEGVVRPLLKEVVELMGSGVCPEVPVGRKGCEECRLIGEIGGGSVMKVDKS